MKEEVIENHSVYEHPTTPHTDKATVHLWRSCYVGDGNYDSTSLFVFRRHMFVRGGPGEGGV